jgi:NADH-quinone oxidoreductase subunit H
MTEYSGFRFLTFFIAEFATAGMFGFIVAVLYLGGWALPFDWFGWESAATFDLDGVPDWMNLVGPLVLFGKMLLVVFLVMWARFTYPRFREDQLQRFAWKVLIPVAVLNIVATAAMKVAF